jgi:hypothetical protein
VDDVGALKARARCGFVQSIDHDGDTHEPVRSTITPPTVVPGVDGLGGLFEANLFCQAPINQAAAPSSATPRSGSACPPALVPATTPEASS